MFRWPSFDGRWARSGTMPGVAVGGQLNVTANATWKKALENLVAQADTTIHGQVENGPLANTKASGAAAASAIPMESAVHGRYVASNAPAKKGSTNIGVLTLSKSYLRTGQTNLTLDGSVSQNSSLQVRLEAEDLREVETIADLFRAPEPGKALQPLGLGGSASFDGTVQGSVQAPHLAGHLLSSNLSVHGTRWKAVRAGVGCRALREWGVEHADLEPASQGRIALNASVGLTDWSFNNMSPVQVDLDAKQLNVAELAGFSGQKVDVTGTLNAQVKLHGSELNPVGNGSVSLNKLVAYGQPVQTMKVTFDGTGDEAHADLAVATTAGGLETKVSVRPKERTYTVQLSSAGIHLDQLQALKDRNVNATGVVALNANGQGSFDNPQLTAGVQIPQLVIQNQTVTGINLQLNLAESCGACDAGIFGGEYFDSRQGYGEFVGRLSGGCVDRYAGYSFAAFAGCLRAGGGCWSYWRDGSACDSAWAVEEQESAGGSC